MPARGRSREYPQAIRHQRRIGLFEGQLDVDRALVGHRALPAPIVAEARTIGSRVAFSDPAKCGSPWALAHRMRRGETRLAENPQKTPPTDRDQLRRHRRNHSQAEFDRRMVRYIFTARGRRNGGQRFGRACVDFAANNRVALGRSRQPSRAAPSTVPAAATPDVLRRPRRLPDAGGLRLACPPAPDDAIVLAAGP